MIPAAKIRDSCSKAVGEFADVQFPDGWYEGRIAAKGSYVY